MRPEAITKKDTDVMTRFLDFDQNDGKSKDEEGYETKLKYGIGHAYIALL